MNKKVIVFGGGTGISYLLKGLKDFPVDITAVITVSDNGRSTGKLRKEFLKLEEQGIKIYMPDLKLCTDNAAMIASAGYYNYINNKSIKF